MSSSDLSLFFATITSIFAKTFDILRSLRFGNVSLLGILFGFVAFHLLIILLKHLFDGSNSN